VWRRIHSALALIALVFITALALSGAILAVFPVTNSFGVAPVAAGVSVADLAGELSAALPQIDRIDVQASGRIVAQYTDTNDIPQSGIVDPASGKTLQNDTGNGGFYVWLKDFHRSFLLGDGGRITAGIGAAALALISASGLVLLASRMGGWGKVFSQPKGTFSARLHTVLTRLTLLPFVLSSLTAIYLTLTQFEVITVTHAASLAFPESTQGLPAVSPGTLAALKAVPLSDLRSLTFPYPGDSHDVFTVQTTAGLTVVDQFTGMVLEVVPATISQRVYNWIYALHTGEGLAWLGALLGLAAAMIPVLGATGVVIWAYRRRARPSRVPGNVPATGAEIVVLVGSESGSTWGFAKSLHRDLTAAGRAVHLAEINAFSGQYPTAKLVLFLTATYGDGHAPASAAKALSVLIRQTSIPTWRYAVVGFGDRAFPKFCQFAKDLDQALADRGWPALMPTTLINRQSTQAFASWGTTLGEALGLQLSLVHHVATPPTFKLTLTERRVFGSDLQAETAILTFRRPSPRRRRAAGWLAKLLGGTDLFTPTDLLGVIPPGDSVPRYYSIANGSSETEVEICVRKQPGGRCSTALHDLKIGDGIDAFVRPNPDFVLPTRRKPVIMVSAGTGIAPFAGLIRDNRRQQSLHLFWGGRAPTSDDLYQDVLQDALSEHRLATLTTAFSRVEQGAYVQDRLRADAPHLAALLRKGAAIMVCGGDAMAHAVRAEFDAILQSIGSSVEALKQRGLYLEDVF